jgi:ADP-heptose:LPS heptosyltransferase
MKGVLVHGGAVGDFVMSLRVVEAMRQVGAAVVTVLGRPEIASIAVGTGGVDAVLDLNSGGFHALFALDAALPTAVRESLQGVGLAVDMLGGPGGVLVNRLGELGIPRVVGIDARPRSDWHEHITDQWLSDLAEAGIAAAPGPPRIHIPRGRREEALVAAFGRRASCDRPAVILHPGSGSRAKCWPLGDYLRLANRLSRMDWRTAFLLGPVEAERFSAREIASLQAEAPLIRGCSPPDAAALLAGVELYIGNDSGMSHLAAAVGAPTIAIFGPTDARRWRPLGEEVVCLTAATNGGWPSGDAVVDAVKGVRRATRPRC